MINIKTAAQINLETAIQRLENNFLGGSKKSFIESIKNYGPKELSTLNARQRKFLKDIASFA
jgi:NOL1/NOP2/fmu family ribosome biogenesis protein